MIRVKISNFIKQHKNKIRDFGKKIGVVAIVVLVATILIYSFDNMSETPQNDIKNDYRPIETIIAGSNVSEEQYEKDSNLVDTFLELCNNGQVEEAYNLLSDECKEELYPTIELFKSKYYDYIFDKKRVCNLQSWISTSKYTIYRIRYSNSMLETGTYDEKDVYEDYITLNKKNEEEKISIGNFIDFEQCNIITRTSGIEATVVAKKIYLMNEEYEIYIKNNTDKTILLDNLEPSAKIWLIADGNYFRTYSNKLYMSDLIIEPGETNKVVIRFMKNLGNNKNSDEIQFLNVIKDYDTYIENKEGYTDIANIEIKVED